MSSATWIKFYVSPQLVQKIAKILFFVCRPPGLDRLLTGDFPRNLLLCYWHLLFLAKFWQKLLLISCVKSQKPLLASSDLSVCPHGRNFTKLGTWIFFEYLSGKFRFRLNLRRKTAFWHEDLINSRATFLIIKNVSEKYYRENQNTHFVTKKVSSENRDG